MELGRLGVWVGMDATSVQGPLTAPIESGIQVPCRVDLSPCSVD